MSRKNAKGKYLCSFCEKSQGDVELIIPGSEANICNECVGICNEIIEDFNKRGKTIQALEKITEPELVRLIMTKERALYSTLGFMLGWAFKNEGAVISRPNPKFDSLLIALEVPRSELQLNSDQAPGDIDMLIVPQNEGHNLYDKTMAVEVKIVRPTVINPSRNANSLGEKQSNKLVNGGFPYVGLLHLIIPEPSPEHLLEETIIRSIGAPKGVISPPDRKGKIDMFPIDSTHRQLGRLRKLRIPDFVGFSATSLVIGIKAGNGQTYLDMIAQSIDMDKEVKPNPNSSHKLQEKVKEHVENYTHRYLNIKWFA